MPSPSFHIHRFIGGFIVMSLAVILGPIFREPSGDTLVGQVMPCPPGMPQCSDLGCRLDGANCQSPRTCCDAQGNISNKLDCCNFSFFCSDQYICTSESSGTSPSPPPIFGDTGGNTGSGDSGNTECFWDIDCDDFDSCTFDWCINGTCSFESDFTDSDADGLRDCIDQCPFDPLKIEPGQCGCHNEDTPNCGGGGAPHPPPPPPPPPPSPAPAPAASPSPTPSPLPPPPDPSPTPSSFVQTSSALGTKKIPTTTDCAKCSDVKDICITSQKFTYIHQSKTLCACFEPGTVQEEWFLCLEEQKSTSAPSSSRPIAPLQPQSKTSSSIPQSISSPASSFVLPHLCGDGILYSPDEECDDGLANSYAPNACRPYCRTAWCGDGITDDLSEDCDAGAMCIGGLLDGPQCAGFGCVRGDPNCISPEACEKGGGACDFLGDATCTLYCTKRRTVSSSASSLPIPSNLIDFFRKSCQRCGDGFFNVCDKKECESFGPCNFTESILGAMWGTCVVKET